jgi:hypothetical protein
MKTIISWVVDIKTKVLNYGTEKKRLNKDEVEGISWKITAIAWCYSNEQAPSPSNETNRSPCGIE